MTLNNLIFSIVLLLLTILGDYLLKKASFLPGLSGWKPMILGATCYFFSAIGWFYIYKNTKFFTLGSFYSLGHFALTILIAIVIFKEKVNQWEFAGLTLGLISLLLLLKSNNS